VECNGFADCGVRGEVFQSNKSWLRVGCFQNTAIKGAEASGWYRSDMAGIRGCQTTVSGLMKSSDSDDTV